MSEAGEALTIADPDEAWVFHILPDDTGRSAIWAAQRVPDDHVSVVANEFVIHDVQPNDSANFLASANLFDVAERHDLWRRDSGVAFDFVKIYAAPSTGGGRAYSNRRVWRVLTLANPEDGASPVARRRLRTRSRSARRVRCRHTTLWRCTGDHYEGHGVRHDAGRRRGSVG
ncbi:hypothetical protein PINS_up020631 [Pythium insidiosum]|nr:hypothetical protein PINS_up020631 [Pythium insidiosum]